MPTSRIEKITQSDAIRILTSAAERMAPSLARAFLSMMERVRQRLSLQSIARMIEDGQADQLLDQLLIVSSPSDIDDYRLAVNAAVQRGAEATAQATGPIEGPYGRFDIRVGVQNPRLAQYAELLTSTRVREIDNATRETLRMIITEGAVDGDGPRQTAIRIRNVIGLTRRQEQAVERYRLELMAGNPNALRRGLRDRRSDSSVGRAIRGDRELSQAQIDSLVERYRDRYIKHRATTIARTETMRAVQGAQHELYEDMIERGQILREQVRRYWIHTGDGNVRNAHMMIPGMNERGVTQDEPFQSPLGPIMFPGDPAALAANTINCRCTVFARILSRELLPRSGTR